MFWKLWSNSKGFSGSGVAVCTYKDHECLLITSLLEYFKHITIHILTQRLSKDTLSILLFKIYD